MKLPIRATGHRSSRRGSVLILVLFVSVVLGFLAVSMAYRSAMILRVSRQQAVLVKLDAQADSVAAIAMSRLLENTADFDHPAQPWHSHGPLAAEGWMDDWAVTGDAAVSFVANYRITDEEGKLHVLRASSESLRKFGMDADQIACLFDYMGSGEYGSSGGASNSYYQSLSPPRRCKNAPLETLDELLAIKEFGTADYWGPRVSDSGTEPGLVELLTTAGSGQVNINTAPRAVLETLGISAEGVGQIDAYRTFDAFSSGQLENHAFRSYQDITQLQGLSDADKDMLAGRVVFRSEHFRIIVTVRHIPTGLTRSVDFLVRRSDDKIDVLQRRWAL